ncbi:hypothetical protein HAX54_016745 [Datura stramonium]|uniref:Uncharacterized protein n=1 Tax=Datura stramonium TaxID=4076 RepID=A0ABS8UJI2_DATST|nr:hypothetical protein [Datura stramonium]
MKSSTLQEVTVGEETSTLKDETKSFYGHNEYFGNEREEITIKESLSLKVESLKRDAKEKNGKIFACGKSLPNGGRDQLEDEKIIPDMNFPWMNFCKLWTTPIMIKNS